MEASEAQSAANDSTSSVKYQLPLSFDAAASTAAAFASITAGAPSEAST